MLCACSHAPSLDEKHSDVEEKDVQPRERKREKIETRWKKNIRKLQHYAHIKHTQKYLLMEIFLCINVYFNIQSRCLSLVESRFTMCSYKQRLSSTCMSGYVRQRPNTKRGKKIQQRNEENRRIEKKKNSNRWSQAIRFVLTHTYTHTHTHQDHQAATKRITKQNRRIEF